MSKRRKNSNNKQIRNTSTPDLLGLDAAIENAERAELARTLALEKALSSTDVNTLMKAQKYLKNVEKKQEVDFKSIVVDPMDMSSALGYKDKNFSISYDVLRGMARTHIVKSIIETRKEQISDFATPRSNKDGVGFIIQKKRGFAYNLSNKTSSTLSKAEEKRIEEITEFVMKCGSISNSWSADDFDDFIRKIVDDSLTLDQCTFEIVRDRGGIPVEFFATDGATYRLADSYEKDEDAKKEVLINGYAPSYVQLYQSNIIAEFYPWELCFGRRNPSSSIYSNGYGRSELEDMIQTVTAILNADTYNANFFKVGSAPKGILKYSGNINPNTVEDFRRQWTAQVSGVLNMHKIPMINAEKLDFINTGQNNKDMEFSKFQEFLIKITCAMYKIDPAEVGFPMQGTTEAGGLGGDGGTKEKIRYSRSKGLKPLLRKIEKWMNKFVVAPYDPQYEFKFVGLDDEDDDAELEKDIKILSNFMTINEIRKKRDLEPIENGDIILNPTYLQAMGMAQQGDEDSNGMVDDMYGEEGDQNPFTQGGYDEDDEYSDDENPFTKSLQQDLGKILGEY